MRYPAAPDARVYEVGTKFDAREAGPNMEFFENDELRFIVRAQAASSAIAREELVRAYKAGKADGERFGRWMQQAKIQRALGIS